MLAGFALGIGVVRAETSYWDVNGTDAGAGTPAALAGTWGIDPYWSPDSNGTSNTVAWTDGNTAVFSAGTDATNQFTVPLGFYPTVGGLVFEEGQVTVGGSENAILTLTNAGGPIDVAAEASARIGAILSGTVGLTKTGSGTLFFINTVPHSYTSDGGTTTNTVIAEGALSVGNGGGTNDGVLQDDASRGHHIINNGTLIFNRNAAFTSFSGVISGSGNFILKSGAGISCSLKLSSLYTNSWAGDTLIEAGRLLCGGSSGRCIPTGPGKGNVHLGTNAVLDVQGNDTQINGLWGYGAITNSYGFQTNDPPHSARTNILTVGDNNQSSTFSGVIKQGNNNKSNHVVLHKIGTGTLTLTRPSTYNAAPTVIHAGTLLANNNINSATGKSEVIAKPGATFGGYGAVDGRVTIEPGGTLSPGDSGAVGKLAIDDSLYLAGNVLIEVNKTALPRSNDLTEVSGTITNAGTGTVTVTNVNSGQPFAPGDTFQIFSQPVLNGSALTIVSAGNVVWTNQLAVDGSIAVVSVNPPPQPPPTPVQLTSVMVMETGSVTVTYTNAIPGTNYVLQCNTNLNVGYWQDIVTNTASGTSASQTDDSATDDNRYYRVFYQYVP